jgi:hypothetical protein
MSALVMFGGESDHPLGFLLKRGFKHCFCAYQTFSFESGHHWVVLDPAKGLPLIHVTAVTREALVEHYEGYGYHVIPMRSPQAIKSPFAISSCVGFVKAVMGIRSMALTPWQLYKHMKRRKL